MHNVIGSSAAAATAALASGALGPGTQPTREVGETAREREHGVRRQGDPELRDDEAQRRPLATATQTSGDRAPDRDA